MENGKTIAFALGGLAGNNAHGAGFLQAALEYKERITPSIISCTSGQLLWVYYYLKALGGEQPDLKAIMQSEIEKVHSTHNINLDMAKAALLGRPGIFRPAFLEYTQELCLNAVKSCSNIMIQGWNAFFLQEFAGCFPGQWLVPLFSKEFFEGISYEFNQANIGIVFNSYNPIEGLEFVYLNRAAKKVVSNRYERCSEQNLKRRRHKFRDRTCYQDITDRAVKNALWLYQYGFVEKKTAFLDGAYYREVILSELTSADRIYVVRPLKYRWVGDLPKSYIGMEDMKTEVGFDGAYAGERNQILLINRLLHHNKLKFANDEKKYKPITLCEIEVEVQRGFFEYIFESQDVFEDARINAFSRFNCTKPNCDDCTMTK